MVRLGTFLLAACLIPVLCAAGAARADSSATAEKAASRSAPHDPAVIEAMRAELDRQFASLSKVPDYPVHYLSYLVNDSQEFKVRARWGSLTNRETNVDRGLDLDLRVGSPELDNTHRQAGAGHGVLWISMDRESGALRADMWLKTERAYRAAVEDYIGIAAKRAVRVEEEDPSPDFSLSPRAEHMGPVLRLSVDEEGWSGKVRRLSREFRKHPEVLESWVEFSAGTETRYFANSEGSNIRQSRFLMEIWLVAQARAEDGMDFSLSRHYPAWDEEDLPGEEELVREINYMGETLAALKKAPLVDPYVGPAILSGKAAAVLFHEVLGHRLEGHRQKDEDADQTFTKRLGKRILPRFISIHSDPTLARIAEIPLMGFYVFDDEGVSARRVALVERGILKGFMMSRSPVRGFPESNGHGRKSLGRGAVARQANLIISAGRVMPVKTLRARMIELCKKQGRPYGLIFEEISGGVTFTGRSLPNAFNVMPLVVRRVYADGSPDELIRGVDLIGTPLTALERIVGAGDDTGVFNGYCGAESGYVPVSAVSPSLLIEEVEVQRKYKGKERLPLLAPPPWPKGER